MTSKRKRPACDPHPVRMPAPKEMLRSLGSVKGAQQFLEHVARMIEQRKPIDQGGGDLSPELAAALIRGLSEGKTLGQLVTNGRKAWFSHPIEAERVIRNEIKAKGSETAGYESMARKLSRPGQNPVTSDAVKRQHHAAIKAIDRIFKAQLASLAKPAKTAGGS